MTPATRVGAQGWQVAAWSSGATAVVGPLLGGSWPTLVLAGVDGHGVGGAAFLQDLHKKYSYIRKTRPDGNCFYRAFGFSHLEALLDDSKELQR